MDRIHVLLISQDSLWKRDVESCLIKEPDLVVIGTVTTKEDAIHTVNLFQVNVVLIDAFSNESIASDLEAALEISRIGKAKVIMLSAEGREENIVQAMGHHAYNYIVAAHFQDILEAIRAAYHNYSPIHPSSAGAVRNEMARMMYMRWRQQLTEAETRILHMVEQGHSQRQMSERLFISESTVKKHINQILKKYHVRTSKEAVRKAKMRGII